jgi:tetraacyldisaccharide 4'-kinase
LIRRATVAKLSGFLEHPGRPGFLRRSLSAAWGIAANPVREVAIPEGARVVGVGGPTLGGSYKTPFVLALASSLAKRGHAVAVAAHGYRARAHAPRRVVSSDGVAAAGDDAVFLARELETNGVPVFAGKPWSAVLALAASHGHIVVVDGLLQASPRRLGWSVLVVDGSHPWKSNRCPPAGDLRATAAALVAASDDVVEVVEASVPVAAPVVPEGAVVPARGRAAFRVESDIVEMRDFRSQILPLDAVAHRRVGLLAAVARPERIVEALRSRGIRPTEIRLFGDHRPLPERRWSPAPVDSWVTTGKCATKLGAHYEGKPVWTLVHRLRLPDTLVDRALGR